MRIETHKVIENYYGASAKVGDKSYFQFSATRQEAFTGVLWQVWEALKKPV